MNRAVVNLPAKVLVDEGAMERLNDFLASLGLGRSCLMVCDPYIRKTYKPKLKIKHSAVSVDGVNKKAIEKRWKFKQDFVLAMGGGRTIDYGKYLAFISGKEWVAFPTTLSHDGIVSSRAVLEDDMRKISVEAKEPAAIIADLSIIKNAPYRLIASGAGDLLSKFSAVEDWKLADKRNVEKYHKLLGDMSLLTAETVVHHKDDIRAMNTHGLEIMIWSLINAGFVMNIYGSSRPASGSEHNFSHALDNILYPNGALHGFQCCLGTLISLYLHDKRWWELRDVMRELQIPTTAEEIGIPNETLVKALVMAKDVRDRYTILNETELNEKKAKSILKAVGII